ncbi:hypothetical protein HP15_2472 [Marinobacter adhaerens HP15]|uniref:Uncharacterized protein n=1 Tax=Marinobacter adhaerens (strain DSM 23420 / HP15) TaxID=225937 RepID=E4PHU8_MARAH|nr:hypothetical protein HP15_2472 [Marinobacter adhaerens HP15]
MGAAGFTGFKVAGGCQAAHMPAVQALEHASSSHLA